MDIVIQFNYFDFVNFFGINIFWWLLVNIEMCFWCEVVDVVIMFVFIEQVYSRFCGDGYNIGEKGFFVLGNLSIFLDEFGLKIFWMKVDVNIF